MQRGLFTAAAGMIIQERRQATTANNLSNVNTTGYKSNDVFSRELEKQMVYYKDETESGRIVRTDVGELSLIPEVDEMYIDYAQGMLLDTESNTDFAIEGVGFFRILAGDEILYSRNGNFNIDREGYLATSTGNRVLARNLNNNAEEPIYIGEQEISLREDGVITLDGAESYVFQLADLSSAENIETIGDSLYRPTGYNITLTNEFKMHQKKLEGSNVNAIDEMVKMIEITRSFESAQKVVQSIDELLSKAVNEVGRAR